MTSPIKGNVKPCNRCGADIYFDRNNPEGYNAVTRKWIPLDPSTHHPHDCPKFVPQTQGQDQEQQQQYQQQQPVYRGPDAHLASPQQQQHPTMQDILQRIEGIERILREINEMLNRHNNLLGKVAQMHDMEGEGYSPGRPPPLPPRNGEGYH